MLYLSVKPEYGSGDLQHQVVFAPTYRNPGAKTFTCNLLSHLW